MMLDDQAVAWFRGNSVGLALGYTIPKQAIYKNLKPKWKKNLGSLISTSLVYNDAKEMYICEVGLYMLVFKCKLPVAEKFLAWVTEEVLPLVRQTRLLDPIAKVAVLCSSAPK